MNEQKTKELKKKYLNAESTLQEENELLEGMLDPDLNDWARFINNEKRPILEDMVPNVMAEIAEKKKAKKRFIYIATSIAASIILLLAYHFILAPEKEMSYNKKVELLNEVLSMNQNETILIPKDDVVYEDEIVIIYLTNE